MPRHKHGARTDDLEVKFFPRVRETFAIQPVDGALDLGLHGAYGLYSVGRSLVLVHVTYPRPDERPQAQTLRLVPAEVGPVVLDRAPAHAFALHHSTLSTVHACMPFVLVE